MTENIQCIYELDIERQVLEKQLGQNELFKSVLQSALFRKDNWET